MREDQELILKAASVARSSPQDWGAFIQALKVFADAEARRCIESPVEQLQRMQGRAQQAAELSALLAGAVKTADSIGQKMAGSGASVRR